jgi:hypothetical protein
MPFYFVLTAKFYNMTTTELLEIDGITPEMAEMYQRAVKERLLFYAHSQSLWFFPDQLAKMWKDGRFRWGARNWLLKHPQESIYQLNQRIQDLHGQIQEISLQRNAIVDYMTKK